MKTGVIKTMNQFHNATVVADAFRSLNISVFENYGKVFKGLQYFETAKRLFAEKGAGGGLIIQRNDKGAGFSLSSHSVLPYLPIVFRGIISMEERRKCNVGGVEKEYLNLRVSIDDHDQAYQKTVSLFVDMLSESLITFLLSEPKYNVMSWLECVIRKNYNFSDLDSITNEKERERERTNHFEVDYSRDAVATLKNLFSKALKGSMSRGKSLDVGSEDSYFDSSFITLWPNQMRIMAASESEHGQWIPTFIDEETSLVGVKCCFVNIFKKITIAKDGCIYISPSTAQVWPLASSLKVNSAGKLAVSDEVLLARREFQDIGVFIKPTEIKKQVADLSFMEEEEEAEGTKKRKRETFSGEDSSKKRKKAKSELEATQAMASQIILPEPPTIKRHRQAVASGWLKRGNTSIEKVEEEEAPGITVISHSSSQEVFYDEEDMKAQEREEAMRKEDLCHVYLD